MKPLTRLYIRAFLWTGLPFATAMAILNVYWGDAFDLRKFLFSFVFFGGLMSLILVGLHRYQLKRKGVDNLDDGALSVAQKTQIQTTLSREEIIDRLKRDPRIGKMVLKADGDMIELDSGATWRSWGERILLKIHQHDGNTLLVEIQSKPKVFTTVVDYGKNKDNVDLITELIG